MNLPEEWIGGRFPAPALVTGGDVPVRPELSLWLEVGGPIVGMEMVPPGDRFGPTVALLRSSMEKPLDGPPRRPARVRVADPELAQALRTEFGPELEVVLGPTREFDDVLASLRDHFAGGPDQAAGDLGDATLGQMAGFYRAAARLYRSAPWELVSADVDLLVVDAEALGVLEHVVSIIGTLGESRGMVVFRSRSDFEQYITEAEHAQRTGGIADLPRHLSLTFERASEVPRRMRKAAAANGWEIASKDAFPIACALQAMAPLDVSPDDLATLEALANALAELSSADPEFSRAWDDGVGFDRTFAVDAAGRRVEVRLRVPAPQTGHGRAGGIRHPRRASQRRGIDRRGVGQGIRAGGHRPFREIA